MHPGDFCKSIPIPAVAGFEILALIWLGVFVHFGYSFYGFQQRAVVVNEESMVPSLRGIFCGNQVKVFNPRTISPGFDAIAPCKESPHIDWLSENPLGSSTQQKVSGTDRLWKLMRKDLLLEKTVSDLISKDMGRRFAVISNYQLPPVSWQNGGMAQYTANPSTLTFNNGFGIQQGGFGSRLGCFGRLLKNAGLLFYVDSLIVNRLERGNGHKDAAHSDDNQVVRWEIRRSNQSTEVIIRIGIGLICLPLGFWFLYESIDFDEEERPIRTISFFLGAGLFVAGSAAFLLPPYYQRKQQDNENPKPSDVLPSHHAPVFHGDTVPLKYLLTSPILWGTVIAIEREAVMANILPMEKKAAVISALAEGAGIRHIPPVTSPLLAVRAAIVREFRNLEPAEEA